MQRANLERDARERQKAGESERYHISGKHGRTIGAVGDLLEAVKAEHPFESLHAHEFEEVTQEEYENTVLDWRYEGNGWEQ
jgi:hypothetical protein